MFLVLENLESFTLAAIGQASTSKLLSCGDSLTIQALQSLIPATSYESHWDSPKDRREPLPGPTFSVRLRSHRRLQGTAVPFPDSFKEIALKLSVEAITSSEIVMVCLLKNGLYL